MSGTDIVFVGDDFTGASDTLATLARTSRRARLFLDPPDREAARAERLDAVGVATDLRMGDAETIARDGARLASAVAALGPRFVHYKVCSTFDSSLSVGNIAAAVGVFEAALAPALVAIIGGQPSLGRYCLFGHLFAADAHGVVHRIDRHPVMRAHPVTPMGESDLRRHLAAQGLPPPEPVTWPEIGGDAATLADRLGRHLVAGTQRFLFDVGENRHLATIGSAMRRLSAPGRPLLLVGASSVAECLILSDTDQPSVEAMPLPAPVGGPCLVIAGSRSSVTARQVAVAEGFVRIAVEPEHVATAQAGAEAAAHCARALRDGRHVLAHLLPERDYGVAGVVLARRLGDLALAIIADTPPSALGIAGGDTSSVIVRRLRFDSLVWEGDLDPGVAICRGRARDPRCDGLRLMLKGGQMGGPDLFQRFACGPCHS